MTDEERQLGLNPQNYAQRPWNAADYVSPMKSIVDQMRSQQESVLGPEPKEMSAEEMAEYQRAKLRRLMGE